MSELSEAYERKKPALHRAARELESILKKIAAGIEDKNLVRAEVRSIRTKELSSVERKAQENGWSASASLAECGDLVGGRVVCNNLEDVYRFAELLREELLRYWDWFEVQDQIKEPDDSGYRALHVNLRLIISDNSFAVDMIPCEVQIRTRLQDAWAELSHDDIYKQGGLPEDLRTQAKHLAEILAAADKNASDIRSRVMREVVPPEQRPDLTRVSAEGLAFIFKDVFGRSPSDYIVRRGLDLCARLGISTLEGLSNVIRRSEFRDELANAYLQIIGSLATNEDLLLASFYAVGKDDRAALRYIRRQARRERRERRGIVQISDEAMAASLPYALQKLINELEHPHDETDILGWASALGATTECAVCGTTIVHPAAFAEAALEHYEVPEADSVETRERIEQAIQHSDVETGGSSDSSLCAYHADQANRDN